MRYCLVVYLKNQCFEITGYSRISGFEHLNERKLKDIVSFTNEFEDETHLINYLINTGLLPEEYFQGVLGINYYRSQNNMPKILPYGISFNEDRKFFDIIFLQYYFRNKTKNIEFMKSFLEKYFNYLKDVKLFSEELNYIHYSFNYYLKYGSLPEKAEEYMEKFVRIYCSKNSKNGYPKADFTRIRELAMFAINYERDFERIPTKIPEHTKEEIEIMLSHYKYIIRNTALSEEENEAYTDTIEKLEEELEIAKKNSLNRRKPNEVTGN